MIFKFYRLDEKVTLKLPGIHSNENFAAFRVKKIDRAARKSKTKEDKKPIFSAMKSDRVD